jgi:hypothetical protein
MGKTARILALALVVAGCGDASAPDTPVATVEAWALSPERLADLLVLAQPLPLDSTTVSALVDEWLVRASVARYELGGGDLLGADATEASLWMETRQATLAAALDAERPFEPPTPAVAQRVFDSDSLRLFAHVLRRVDTSTSSEERALQRRTAQEILNSLRSGRSWPQVVVRSEDDATRDVAGLLGLMRVDELPVALRTVGGQLLPGQVSAVVESPAGYHILYRPRFGDVADLFRELLQERLREQRDDRATLETLAALDLEVPDEAIARARQLADLPRLGAGERDPVLAWEGGALGDEVLARYLASLPILARKGLATSSDDDVAVALGQLAAREARIQAAGQRGVRPDSARMAELGSLQREEVALWREAVPVSGGEEAARAALGRYMERLVSRQEATPPVPPVLRWWLLSRLEWSRDAEAMNRAIDRARELVRSAGAGGSAP